MPEATPVPPTPTKPAPTSQGHTREQAVAYYEKVRKQLRDLIHQKRHHDKQLVTQLPSYSHSSANLANRHYTKKTS
jgi:hypothetical protein